MKNEASVATFPLKTEKTRLPLQLFNEKQRKRGFRCNFSTKNRENRASAATFQRKTEKTELPLRRKIKKYHGAHFRYDGSPIFV